jgi:hypothetical protein
MKLETVLKQLGYVCQYAPAETRNEHLWNLIKNVIAKTKKTKLYGLSP